MIISLTKQLVYLLANASNHAMIVPVQHTGPILETEEGHVSVLKGGKL